MTAQVRQNVYAAWQDGDVSAMEALRSLCADYEEADGCYKDFERIREGIREQIGNVLAHLDNDATVPGFGRLLITEPSITVGYDKAQIRALMDELAESHPELAERLSACQTRSMRAGGLRIEREKAAR